MLPATSRALLLAAALLVPSASAQVSLGWQTAPVFGAYGNTQPTDMDVTDSGTCYVSGYVPSQSGNPAPGLSLMRIEPDGSVPWSVLFPLALAEPSFIATSPPDGGIVQVASYFHFAAHQYRTMIVKYDGTGAVSWSQDVPGLTTTTEIRKPTRFVGVDALGNSYVGGNVGSASRIVSFDPAGNLRFTTPLSLAIGAFATSPTIDVLTVDPVTGDVFVAGHAGFNPAAGTLSYAARLNSSGTVTWIMGTAAPAGQYVWVRDIGVDAQARVSVLAQHSTSDSYTGTTSLTLDRRDALGALLGSISYAAPATVAQALDVAADGTIAVSGYKSGVGAGAFVARYDAALALQWERTVTIPGAAFTVFDGVSLAGNGDVTATGLRYLQRFSGLEADSLCLSFDANGDTRWQFLLGISTAHELPIAHAVDGVGRVRVTLHQLPANGSSPYEARPITFELDPQSHSFCHGDGTSGACPCANVSGPLDQAGCTNSNAGAARLEDSGAASLSNDTLTFTCTGVDATAIGLLAEGSAAIQPFVFGDGIFCFGGSIQRLYITVANSGVLTMPSGLEPAVHLRSAALGGPISAGERRVYQTYYRDASLPFCPTGGTFNFSNALLVHWTP
jgi:hypothetical protein